MNHVMNAKLNKLPACPECGVDALKPCVTFRGGSQVREPHHVREQVARGEVFVISEDAARKAHQLRAIRELAATIQRPATRALEQQVADLKRSWGLAARSRRG